MTTNSAGLSSGAVARPTNSQRRRFRSLAVTSSFLIILLSATMTSLADAQTSGPTTCPPTVTTSGCSCASTAEAEGEISDPSDQTHVICPDLRSATAVMNSTGPAQQDLQVASLTVRVSDPQQGLGSVAHEFLGAGAETKTGRLIRLVNLHLNEDGIKSIAPGAFDLFADLKKLTLQNNELRVLQPGTFQGLRQLTVLDLSGNPLYAVDADVFCWSHIPLITHLELGNCRIVDFEPGAMTGLDGLEILNMTSNRLDALPVLGDGLDHLVEVDLSLNYIRSLERSDGLPMSAPGPEVLRLDRNLIDRLTNTSMLSRSPSPAGYRLTELVLSDNAITSVETGSLSGCVLLTDLDLSRNRLTSVDAAALPWANLTRVLVGGNPWNCSMDDASTGRCAINAWLVTQRSVEHFDVTCASPSSVAGKDVYADHVLDACLPGSAGGPSVALAVCLTLLIFLLLVLIVVVIVSRRRHRRAHLYRASGPDAMTSSSPTSSTGHTPSPFGSGGGWRKGSTPKRSPSSGDGHDDTWSSNIGYRQMVDLGPGTDNVSGDQNEL